MEAVSNALKKNEKERDDCDLFGKQVALELRQMSSYSRDMMKMQIMQLILSSK
jgi:hypothetical protein